jgi:hypothetical protein
LPKPPTRSAQRSASRSMTDKTAGASSAMRPRFPGVSARPVQSSTYR